MPDDKFTQPVPLGSTGIKISPLGLGAWSWGDSFFWGYGNGYGEADVRAAFEASASNGISLFDTAEAYGSGKSEEILGRLVRSNGRSTIVATKFFPYPWRLSGAALIPALKRSLKRLGLPRVDLYQIHWPIPPVPIDTWMREMSDAVDQGLTRAAGVSNYSLGQTKRAHAALASRGIPLASNQVKFSLLNRSAERTGLLQFCRERQITLIAYSPIAQGLLSGKYKSDNPPAGVRRFRYSKRLLAEIVPLLTLMRSIGEDHGGKTPVQVALNWVLCKGAVPIPGAKNARQAQENIGAVGWRLTDAEVTLLDDASDRVSR